MNNLKQTNIEIEPLVLVVLLLVNTKKKKKKTNVTYKNLNKK